MEDEEPEETGMFPPPTRLPASLPSTPHDQADQEPYECIAGEPSDMAVEMDSLQNHSLVHLSDGSPAGPTVLEVMGKLFGRSRPESHYWDGRSDLDFCVYDIDTVSMPPIRSIGHLQFDKLCIAGSMVPVLRLHGTTREGYTVAALARGFLPYIYVRMPNSMLSRLKKPASLTKIPTDLEIDKDTSIFNAIAQDPRHRTLCQNFRASLIQAIKTHQEQNGRWNNRTVADSLVFQVEFARRQTVMGDFPTLAWFLKITFGSPNYIPTARDILTRTLFRWAPPNVPDRDIIAEKYQVFEANIPFPLRYMIDMKLYASAWVTLKSFKYTTWSKPSMRNTTCDIEVIFNANDLIPHPPDVAPWDNPPMMRRLTFDIECAADRGRFPLAELDPAIAISNRLSFDPYPPPGRDRIVADLVFCWGFVSPISSGHILHFYQVRANGQATEDEAKFPFMSEAIGNGLYRVATYQDEIRMLRAWRYFIIHIVDPTVLCGHNHTGFDVPYLLDRAAALGIGEEFAVLGMSRREKTRVKVRTFSSKQFGSKDMNEFEVPGRLILDTLPVCLRQHKLRSYKLNALAEKFLNDFKIDLPHQEITPKWYSGPKGRQVVTEYCMWDTVLTDRLADLLLMFIDTTEMSRTASVPFKYIINRGLQIRIVTLLMRSVHDLHLLVPFCNEEDMVICNEKYKGATVLEPQRGFYDVPILTLDFSGLYPSIMMSHNLCVTTSITAKQAANEKPEDVIKITTEEDTVYFLRTHRKTGIYPKILRELKVKRAEAKEAIKTAPTPEKKKVLDRRQNNIKLNGNSVYGVAGAPKSQIANRGIAQAVTSRGRSGIELTSLMIQDPMADIPRNEEERLYDGIKPEEAARRTAAYEQRCIDARANYPIPFLPGETPEQRRARVRQIIRIIYGDSVTGDTPILIRAVGSEYIYPMKIEDLDGQWAAYGTEKEAFEPCNPYLETWTESGWTRLHRVIRHRTVKSIYRVWTNTGVVDVTEDHGLLLDDGQATEICPTQVYSGMMLVHSDLPVGAERDTCQPRPFGKRIECKDEIVQSTIINSPRHVRQAYLDSYCAHLTNHLDYIFEFTCKMAAQSFFILASSLDYYVSFDVPTSNYSNTYVLRISKTPRSDADARAVQQVVFIGQLDSHAYVYDFETENHHFAAGVGRMVVHNTDSVMIRAAGHSLVEALSLGKRSAEWITKYFFPAEMELAFEKVYFPMLLITKKRYAGLWWTKPDKYDKRDTKGLESTRRDGAPIVAQVIDKMLDEVLRTKKIESMVTVVTQTIDKIRDGSIDYSKLIISKALSKRPEQYGTAEPGKTVEESTAGKPAHAMLAIKMAKREPATAPKMGDRVPYIIVARDPKKAQHQLKLDSTGKRKMDSSKGKDSMKTAEKAEDPKRVLEHNLPVDIDYYIYNQLFLPVDRILEPLVPGITTKLFSAAKIALYVPESVKSDTVDDPNAPHPVAKAVELPPIPTITLSQHDGSAVQQSAAKKIKKDKLAGQMTLTAFGGVGEMIKPPPPKLTEEQRIMVQYAGSLKQKAKQAAIAAIPGQRQLFSNTVTMRPAINLEQESENASLLARVPAIYLGGPSKEKGGIGQFLVNVDQCLACHRKLPIKAATSLEPVPAFCLDCSSHKLEGAFADTWRDNIRGAWQNTRKDLEDINAKLWATCVKCQKVSDVESLTMCLNIDCVVLWRRKNAKEKVERLQTICSRFESKRAPLEIVYETLPRAAPSTTTNKAKKRRPPVKKKATQPTIADIEQPPAPSIAPDDPRAAIYDVTPMEDE